MPQKPRFDRRAFAGHASALLVVGLAVMLAGCAQSPQTAASVAGTAPTLPAVGQAVATAMRSLQVTPAVIAPTQTAQPTLAASVTAAPFPTVATLAATASPTATATLPPEGQMQIRLTISNASATATLNHSKAAEDFASLLPLTLTLQDYNGTEKISDLSKRLSTEGAPTGIDPNIGDITYYAPWGNLAIFYRDFGFSTGLVLLGKLDDGMELLAVPRSVRVTIERID